MLLFISSATMATLVLWLGVKSCKVMMPSFCDVFTFCFVSNKYAFFTLYLVVRV